MLKQEEKPFGESIRTTIFIPRNVKRYLDILILQDRLDKKSTVNFSSLLIDLALKEIERRGFDPTKYPEIKISQE